MRILLGAVCAVVVLSGSAWAQTDPVVASESSTVALDTAPTLPDGATANASAITSGDAAFRAWFAAGADRLARCRAEVEAARLRVRTLEEIHNGAADELNGTRDRWQVEVNEYNLRGRR